MYKIVLVDDEKLVLKSLKGSIDWETYGFEVIGTALSAEEALEMIRMKKPDVVFTDIRMPQICGLELLQMIKEAYPDIICMIISGYAEFAYIQKAIKLDAVGYCLKPFDYDEITGYLKKIKSKLDSRNKAQNTKRIPLEYLDIRSKDAKQRLKDFFEKKDIFLERDKIKILYLLGQTEELLELSEDVLAYSNVGYEKYIVLLFETCEQEFIEILINHKKLTSKKISVGVSRSIDNVEQVGKRVQDARKLAYQFFCQPEKYVFDTMPDDRKVSLIPQLYPGNKQDAGRIAGSIKELRMAFAEGQLSIDAGILLRNFMETWTEEKINQSLQEVIWDYDTLCQEYENADHLLTYFSDQLWALREEDVNKITNQTFAGMRDYVKEHFREHITVADISLKFHINSCYVSRLFKKEMGKTLTDFLTELRIENACRMLVDSGVSINEIAELSGFSDYFYFARVFRKVMHCTPSEYRAEYGR